MATAKKTTKSDAFQIFKADLAEGSIANAYIFYGEESYLREFYLGELRKKLVPAGFEEFNYHKLEGKEVTVQSLAEMAEAMPMLAERTLLVVTDFDLFKLSEEQQKYVESVEAKIKELIEKMQATKSTPKWLECDSENLTAKVVAIPEKSDIDFEFQEQLIVELYSK